LEGEGGAEQAADRHQQTLLSLSLFLLPACSIQHPKDLFSEDLSCFIDVTCPSAPKNSDSLLLPKAKTVGVTDKRPFTIYCNATAVHGYARLTVLVCELRLRDSPAPPAHTTLIPAHSTAGWAVAGMSHTA